MSVSSFMADQKYCVVDDCQEIAKQVRFLSLAVIGRNMQLVIVNVDYYIFLHFCVIFQQDGVQQLLSITNVCVICC